MYQVKNSQPAIKNLHLAISVILIIPVALVYGLKPGFILPKLFDFKIQSNDLAGIFRATMGLYLGMTTIWIMGIFKPKYWMLATITTIVFMGGLAMGRLLSLVVDGIPSSCLLFGFIVESALAFLGLKNLRKYGDQVSAGLKK
jgi:hypothetical protein